MSIEAMVWAMRQHVVEDPAARHVLLVLANYAGEDGRNAFPSTETLVNATGLSERTVRYKLDHLVELGVIRRGKEAVVAAHIERADRRPQIFDIALERGADTAPRAIERGAPAAPRDESRGANDDSHGVQMTTERGAPAAPEPSSKPSSKPSRAAPQITLKVWMGMIEAKGEKPVSGYEPVHRWAQDVNLPQDLLVLAWYAFVRRYGEHGSSGHKRYKDWRKVFLKALEGNWLKLWYIEGDSYKLTTTGVQEDLLSRRAA